MKAVWVAVALASLLGGLLWGPGDAAAGPLLFPNGGVLPGELGYLMGGAQVALASSGESIFYNPAGLALETGRRVTAGGDLLRLRTTQAGGPATTTADTALDSVAYAQRLGERRGYPRFTLGLALQSTGRRLPTQIAQTRQGTSASLPPGFTPPGGATNIDTNFPDGLTLADTGEARGELRVLAPGMGLGIAPADWLRVGLALRVERLALAERLAVTTTYSATASGGKTLDGHSQLAWVLAGDALRLTGSAGVQMELTRSLVLGIALVLPSHTLDGSGRVLYQRSDTLTVDTGSPSTASDAIYIARSGLPFRLDTPRRVQLGLAFRSDRFLVELDLYRLSSQGSYAVLPGTESQPPSSTAFALPALRTSGRAVLGIALGMAYAQSERTSLLLSFAADPSPVPPDDPLFRSVGVTTVGAGVYHVRGDLSLSAGLLWREAREPRALDAPPDGGQPVTTAIALRELDLRVAGSLAF